MIKEEEGTHISYASDKKLHNDASLHLFLSQFEDQNMYAPSTVPYESDRAGSLSLFAHQSWSAHDSRMAKYISRRWTMHSSGTEEMNRVMKEKEGTHLSHITNLSN